MASRKVDTSQKKEILELFKSGKTIKDISKLFNFTIPTITRQLKTLLDIEEFKKIKNKKFHNQKSITTESKNNSKNLIEKKSLEKENFTDLVVDDNTAASNKRESNPKGETSNINSFFVELPPINAEIDSSSQKDLSSIHISEIDFPKVVYMVVDNKIELEIKFLKDFPEWEFLPQDDLNRKTIEIFFDLNLAKRSCNKQQKVIKVPNTDVFRITAPILVSKGISRIVCPENLIAL